MKRKKYGLTLMEERFCQLAALGHTARDAYAEAFSVAVVDQRSMHNVDNRAGRLMKRPDIISRIAEAQGEAKRKNREKWEGRGEEIAEGLYSAIATALVSTTKDGKPCILERDTLKGIEVLAKLKGLNAPEETVLKNGGLSDDYVPRGIEGMSDADLKAIIAAEEPRQEVLPPADEPGGEEDEP